MMPEEEAVLSVEDEEEKSRWTSVHGKDLLIGMAILWAVELLLGLSMILWVGDASTLEQHPVAILMTMLISAPVTLLVCWFFVCKKYGKSLSSGFLMGRPNRKSLVVAGSIGIGYGLVAVVLMVLFSTGQSMFGKMAESTTGLLCLIIIALLVPVIEEVYYRGFLFPVFQNKWGSRVAVIIVTLWFGGVHVFQNTEDLMAVPVLFVLSLIMTLQRCITKSLTPCIITHWTYNFTMVIASVLSALMT
jgi:membrane protease YdiL (CAAX protease family)